MRKQSMKLLHGSLIEGIRFFFTLCFVILKTLDHNQLSWNFKVSLLNETQAIVKLTEDLLKQSGSDSLTRTGESSRFGGQNNDSLASATLLSDLASVVLGCGVRTCKEKSSFKSAILQIAKTVISKVVLIRRFKEWGSEISDWKMLCIGRRRRVIASAQAVASVYRPEKMTSEQLDQTSCSI